MAASVCRFRGTGVFMGAIKMPKIALLISLCAIAVSAAARDLAPMQTISGFQIDRTEVSVGQFRGFAKATSLVTAAERDGGLVYEAGWVRKPGWNWRAPYGKPAADNEPAVHLSFQEAAAFCRWVGKRLPTDAEWVEAAYVEHRSEPPPPFVTGRRYRYPVGDSSLGANCLGDCGAVKPVQHQAVLWRGAGHAPVGTTRPGVYGLYAMGANVFEWVDAHDGGQRRTRGGSWWYGEQQMRESHLASKPPEFGAVYIGFRCVR
ncbi:MAG: SUMF1/EgtB/PvdO family nonheme iron enzyme [Quisquiliibacterium sp.]